MLVEIVTKNRKRLLKLNEIYLINEHTYEDSFTLSEEVAPTSLYINNYQVRFFSKDGCERTYNLIKKAWEEGMEKLRINARSIT